MNDMTTTIEITMTQSDPKRIWQTLPDANRPLPKEWNEWNFLDMVNDEKETWKTAPMIDWSCPNSAKKEMSNAVLVAVVPNAVCEECLARYEKGDQEHSKIKKALQEKIDESIPPIYQATDPERLPWKQVQEVLAWSVPREKFKTKGLWIVGDTRTGKTRTLCLLLKDLIGAGRQVRTFFHGSFGDELLEVIRSERSFRAWKKEITQADYLVIDDLFSFKMTERVEASIFEILDERIAHYRPTLVTTQLTKNDAQSRFASLKRWEAFFARIKEFFVIVATEKPTQADLKI